MNDMNQDPNKYQPSDTGAPVDDQADTQQPSYVDGYQPPAEGAVKTQGNQPTSEPEIEVNPTDAKAALDQVMKQLDEVTPAPVEDKVVTKESVVKEEQVEAKPKPAAETPPTPAVKSPSTEETTDTEAEIAKAKATLEEILKEIETKRKTQDQKSQSSTLVDSGAKTEDVTMPKSSAPKVDPAKKAVTDEEARQAREELARILDEIETQSKKDGTVGVSQADDQDASASSQADTPAQPTVPTPPPPVTQTDSDVSNQPATKDLLDFETEDDLPVVPNEVKQAHDEVVQAEVGTHEEAKKSATDPQSTSSANSSSVGPSEKLDDQNIFFMLGVDDAKEDEKEKFLDELQQVVWEDFLDNDVKLLLTQEEYQELEKMIQAKPNASFMDQAEIVNYLEKRVPDLEEIMVEKAMELKADMFKERLADLKSRYQSDSEKLHLVNQAEELMNQGKWYSAAKTLNQLK